MDTVDNEGTPLEWMPLREAAQRVGRSTKTIRRQVKAGQLVAQRAGDSETSPWLVSSLSLAEVYGEAITPAAAEAAGVAAEATAEVVTALSSQLSDVTAMLSEANQRAEANAERAAIAETRADHYQERIAELRDELAAQSTVAEKRRRWWQR